MALSHQPLVITEDDDALARMVAAGQAIPLLAAAAFATRDLSVLREDLRPDPFRLLEPDGGVDPHQIEEIRRLALQRLRAYRDAGSPPVPPPSIEDLRALLEFVTGQPISDDYLALFREELAVEGEDLRAPGWHLRDVDPGRTMRVAVIGAGMSGLLAAFRLQQAGLDVVIVEKNDDVGGTWLENRYPGCRVDVPNHFYSYSFVQRDDWPQHFSTQDVLLDYFRACAEEFGVRDRIRFGTEVEAAVYDDSANRWTLHLRTAAGTEELEADAIVSAVGQLNRPKYPDIPGVDAFTGPAFHSARWDSSVDLAGKRVAVIGTGASAVQLIPEVAQQAAHLTVFQRTPNWLVPTEDYHDEVEPEVMWLFRHLPGYAAWYRFWVFWKTAEGLVPAARVDPDWDGHPESVSMLNEFVRQLLTQYLEAQFDGRPDLLEACTPHYPPIAKRVLRDNGIWARTLARDDVTLVTEAIDHIDESGVVTADGEHHDADVLIHGTGFHASKFLAPMRVRGRGGIDLHEQWGSDPVAYLGIAVPGFPNFFCLYGPNTNIVINGSIIFFSECEVRYLVGCLRLVAEKGAAALDCRPDVHRAFGEEVDAENRRMAWGVSSVNSWYKNEKGRVTQNWPFSLLEYWRRTREPDPGDFELLPRR